MADDTWPSTLQQDLDVSGFSETLPDNMIASQVDVGISKRRKRFTVELRPIDGSIICTPAQKTTLEDFYETTLQSGVKRFNWINPVTKSVVEMRFRDNSPPQFSAVGPVNFRARLQLEQLP